MKRYSLSWVFGVGKQAVGGNKKPATWLDISSSLDEVNRANGSVTLGLINGPDIGPQSLQVISDNDKYVLSLGEDDGADYFIRSYRNTALQGQQYEVLGDMWDGLLVCLDFDIVKSVFEEFFLTGNVSKKLLD